MLINGFLSLIHPAISKIIEQAHIDVTVDLSCAVYLFNEFFVLRNVFYSFPPGTTIKSYWLKLFRILSR